MASPQQPAPHCGMLFKLVGVLISQLPPPHSGPLGTILSAAKLANIPCVQPVERTLKIRSQYRRSSGSAPSSSNFWASRRIALGLRSSIVMRETGSYDALAALLEADDQLVFQMNQVLKVSPSIQTLHGTIWISKKTNKDNSQLTPSDDALAALLEADDQLVFQMNQVLKVSPSIQTLHGTIWM
nr:hypothetical protein Iba_chr02aCG3150 [Ipomoea batatas]